MESISSNKGSLKLLYHRFIYVKQKFGVRGGFVRGGFCSGGFCPGGFCPGGFVRGVLSGGVLSGGVLSGGVCPGGVLSGGFCPGGFCPGGFCPRGGFVHRGVLSSGVLSGGFCPGGFVQVGFVLESKKFSSQDMTYYFLSFQFHSSVIFYCFSCLNRRLKVNLRYYSIDLLFKLSKSDSANLDKLFCCALLA